MPDSTWNDPRITSYVLDELTGDDLMEFEAELADSEDLAVAVEEVRSITGQLQDLYSDEKTKPLDQDRRESIMSGAALLRQAESVSEYEDDQEEEDSIENVLLLDQIKSSNRNHGAPTWGVPLLVIASAAVLLLLVGLAPWLRERSTITSVDPNLEQTQDVPAPAPAPIRDMTLEDTVATYVESNLNDWPSKDESPKDAASEDNEDEEEMASTGVLAELEAIDHEFSLAQKVKERKSKASTPGTLPPPEALAEPLVAGGDQPDQMRADQPAKVAMRHRASIAKPRMAAADAAPEAMTQQTQSPGAQSPGAQSPGAQSPGAQSPPREEDAATGIVLPEIMRASTDSAAPLVDLDSDSLAPGTMKQSEASIMMRSAMDKYGLDHLGRNAQAEASGAQKNPFPSVLPPISTNRALQSESTPSPMKAQARRTEIAPPLSPKKQQDQEKIGAHSSSDRKALALEATSTDGTDSDNAMGYEKADSRYQMPLTRGRGSRSGLIRSGGKVDKLHVRHDDLGEDPRDSKPTGGDRFEPISENQFQLVAEAPVSTFSVDVDTVSYGWTRDSLLRFGAMPHPQSVRIEDLVNYFVYDYQPPAPKAEHPFHSKVSVMTCPWNPDHRLARVAIQGQTMQKADRLPCNLVFLLDTSASMDEPNKLPWVVEGIKTLADQLTENDRVAIAVYAGAAGLALDSVTADQSQTIRQSLFDLSTGGNTDSGQGLELAYRVASENFITDGVNRVILCTDGDFNVGATGTDELLSIVEKESKDRVFLTVLGFGMGNHNDAMLEQIRGRGNGNYAFIESQAEAKKILVEQTSGDLGTIAKDVSLQLEFNPTRVAQYRLIGYENQMMSEQDSDSDKQDAIEIDAGHSVTALYEIVPRVSDDETSHESDKLRYQRSAELTKAATSNEILTLEVRYTLPNEDDSMLISLPIEDKTQDFDEADADARFAVAVAGFGMKLRDSKFASSWTLSDIEEVAAGAVGDDTYQLRAEFLQMVRKVIEINAAK